MEQQPAQRVTPRPLDLRVPRAVTSTDTRYLVDTRDGDSLWLTGVELFSQRPPLTVRAIAWRV